MDELNALYYKEKEIGINIVIEFAIEASERLHKKYENGGKFNDDVFTLLSGFTYLLNKYIKSEKEHEKIMDSYRERGYI